MALCLAGAREWKKIEKKDATGGGPSSEKRVIGVFLELWIHFFCFVSFSFRTSVLRFDAKYPSSFDKGRRKSGEERYDDDGAIIGTTIT